MTLVGWMLISMLGLAPLAVQQDEPAEKKQSTAAEKGEGSTIVVKLSHLAAEEAGRALHRLGYQVKIAESEQNPGLLMVRGAPEVLREIQERVIPMLDVPAVSQAGSGESIAYIPMANQPAKNIIELLETVAPPDGGTGYAIDQVRRMLVVRGAEPQIEAVKRLVRAIDRPAPGLTLHFFFIRGNIADAESERESYLPAELAGVSKTLLANGLNQLSLMAPVVINARGGEHFETHARLGAAREGVETEPVSLNVDGLANLLPEAQVVHMNVRASVDVGTMSTAFSTATTVSTKLGAYTILAAAPGTTTDGEAIAVALRVTSDAE